MQRRNPLPPFPIAKIAVPKEVRKEERIIYCIRYWCSGLHLLGPIVVCSNSQSSSNLPDCLLTHYKYDS